MILAPLTLFPGVKPKSFASTPVTASENVTVNSTLGRFVGLGLTRILDSTNGGVASEGVPYPLSETLSGEELALLGMETDPTFVPVEAGEKVTPKVQVSAGATVALVQVLLLNAKFPVMDRVPITRLAEPVLVTVKDFAVLVEPTA